MKTLGPFSPGVASLAVTASLVLFAGGVYASGPAGGMAAGNSGTAAGAVAGVGVTGAGFSGAARGGGLSSGAAISGARSGVPFSNNALGARGAAFRGNGVASGLSSPYHNVYNRGFVQTAPRLGTSTAASRPANAWSGMAVNQPSNGNATAARTVLRSNYRSNNWTDNNGFTGQRLYPGTPGSNLPSYNRGDYSYNRGGNYYHLRNRYSYYPYAYGPAYAPYISYFGGDYAGAYPYYNDIAGLDTSYENSSAATVSPQYAEQAPANNDNAAQSDPSQQPDAASQPAPQRQGQPDAGRGTIPSNGPDSLVEAVQDELVRRGYFGGKVDAMFNADTKEALRKFQADHHLAATGLINEATLHALQLD